MSHVHTHGNVHTHSHAPSTANRLAAALLITLAFVGFEAAAGLWANSLALLTDAAHNVTDVVALGLAWYALRLAHRPASPNKTYGYHRAAILVALVNAAGLIVIALVIFYEAYQRLMSPVAFLQKPFPRDGLINSVEQLLRQRSSR